MPARLDTGKVDISGRAYVRSSELRAAPLGRLAGGVGVQICDATWSLSNDMGPEIRSFLVFLFCTIAGPVRPGGAEEGSLGREPWVSRRNLILAPEGRQMGPIGGGSNAAPPGLLRCPRTPNL